MWIMLESKERKKKERKKEKIHVGTCMLSHRIGFNFNSLLHRIRGLTKVNIDIKSPTKDNIDTSIPFYQYIEEKLRHNKDFGPRVQINESQDR